MLIRQPPLGTKVSLASPNRPPGFDPSHPMATATQLSAVFIGGTFVNLSPGYASTFGTVAGTAAQKVDGVLGACKDAGTSYDISFTGGTANATGSPVTMAAIIRTSTADNAGGFPCYGTTGPLLADFNGPFSLDVPGATISSGITLADNTPYFVAASWTGNTSDNLNFIVRNLNTGSILTGTGNSGGATNSYAGTGFTVGFEGKFSTFWLGRIAAVFAARAVHSPRELRAWAEDPWSFWYPLRTTTFVGIVPSVAGLPPGQQSFALPQPDRNTNTFPPNLRSWSAPDRLILIGQDQFPPGTQRYDRQPDPQDAFSTWRSYVDNFPPTLIAQDKLPSGKQVYDLPISQVPDPFARWRSWTYSYNLNLIGLDALPPGRQSYQRSIDPADAFAQWRSWTWQYRPILIGQDVFPPGTQLYSRQVDPQDSFSQWRSWTNFNINLFPPPAVAILPPGAQLYSRFIDPVDGFAQWRSFAWFSRNLAGQDAFPPGRQINFLPLGATWRPESPQPNLIPALTFVPPAPPPGVQLYALWSPLFDSFAQWRSFANFNINLFPPPPVVPPPPGQQLFALPPYGPPPLVPPINYVNPVIYGIPTPPPSVIPIPATYYLLEDLWINNTYLPAGTVQKTADLGGVLPINWVPNPNVDPVDPNAIAAYAAAGYRPRGLIRTQFTPLPVNAPNYNWKLVNNEWTLVKGN